ncbi:MAG: hypothetical protein ABIW03_06190 [Sphingomicrobium sp.]
MTRSKQLPKRGAFAVLIVGTVAMTLAVQAPAAPKKVANETHSGTLTALNGSGATGTLRMQLSGERFLTVQIDATGLEVGVPHVGHIHGLVMSGHPANSVCPTTAQDSDHDGYVELAEGQVTYGPIVVPFGNVDPNMDGIVHFTHTYDLNDSSIYATGFSKSDLLPIDLREVVLHGLTLQTGDGVAPGEADGTAGFKAVLPVSCGDIDKTSRNAMEFVAHHNH